jgi:hypothetical protein
MSYWDVLYLASWYPRMPDDHPLRRPRGMLEAHDLGVWGV